MQKSFIERIFPPPQESFLPTHESIPTKKPSTSSSPRITLRDSSQRRSSHSSSSAPSLQPTPLGASLIHHEDPLLPIERAAKSLQQNIQNFLDAQTTGLDAGFEARGEEDVSSIGSPTPSPSITNLSGVDSKPRTIPVRQPIKKRITLKAARRGLVRCMVDFAQLKSQEIKVLETESQLRDDALLQTEKFEQKRKSLAQRIESIEQRKPESGAASLRNEAQNLEQEIQKLETRLFEMRARQRHLLTQAEQLESSAESKLSSYKSSLAMIDKQASQFLTRPPILRGSPKSQTSGIHTGMYAIRPERRTMQMAQEQWTAEKEMLQQQRLDAEKEKQALEKGAQLWRDAVKRINDFEKKLRTQTEILSKSQVQENTFSGSSGNNLLPSDIDTSPQGILQDLSSVISLLETDLAYAESQQWNLLICCLGAELEAFQEAQRLLEHISDLAIEPPANGPIKTEAQLGRDESLKHSITQLENGHVRTIRSPSAHSNRSLEDTLREFGNGLKEQHVDHNVLDDKIDKVQQKSYGTSPTKGNLKKNLDTRSESEDDDPGPDFFVSHA